MAALSNYLETAVLNWIRGTAMPTAPSTVYIGVFSDSPGDDASGTEITSTITGSANRIAVTFGTVTDASGAGQIANSGTVTITASAAGGGTVSHIGLFDAQTGGNLLYHGALTAPVVVAAGNELKIETGLLKVQLT